MDAQTATNQGVQASTSKAYVIPTPQETDDVPHYDELYDSEYTLANTLIKVEGAYCVVG